MRILLADSQAKVRFALRVLLERQVGVQVVGEANDAENLLKLVGETDPDILLLGWELPGRLEKDLLGQVHKTCPRLTVIALSGRPEAQQASLAAGADAFVSKTDPPERLLLALGSYGCWRAPCDQDGSLGDA
jgi:DNA-binding NarL/FixJ family response regulator